MTCCATPLVAEGALDSAGIAARQRLEELKSSARILEDGTAVYVLSVPAVHCGQCIATIEDRLKEVDHVISARVNLTLRRVTVKLDSEDQSPGPFAAALDDLGYKAQLLSEDPALDARQEFGRLIRALAVAGFASANIMLLSISVWTGAAGATRELFHLISAIIAVPAVAVAGQPFFRSAASALRARHLNMDVPISLGVLLTLSMSLYESLFGGHHAYFDAAIGLLFFLLIGRTLDHLMRVKSRAAVERLSKLSAKGAMAVGSDNEINYRPVDEIVPGMVLRVTAGERIPVDCIVRSGWSDIDRSLVTGESAPVPVIAGMPLEAGTLNLTGALDVLASRSAKESFLSEIVAMMEAAEHGRGKYDRIADRLSRAYAPAVHLLAIATFLGWMTYTAGDWHQSLTVAVAVLIITCPCALGLAVPVAHVIAAERLFNSGVLMKDGSALERLAGIDHVVFDKTGTLTTGEPRVISTDIPHGELWQLAAALASRSVHPVSKALARHLTGARVELDAATEFPGLGVEGRFGDIVARLGRAEWVGEIVRDTATPLQEGVAFGASGGAIYFAQVSEEIRPGAALLVSGLNSVGVSTEILSGDSLRNVSDIASQLKMTQFRASLRPGDKLHHVQRLANSGRKVLMIGDGLNDVPALAAARVSMAPASATDVGRAAADFVLTRENLGAVSYALVVAEKANRIVKQNFALAIAYNVVVVPLAMLGALNPLIAALAMSSSSLLVVGNSMRLMRGGSRRADVRQSEVQGHLMEARTA